MKICFIFRQPFFCQRLRFYYQKFAISCKRQASFGTNTRGAAVCKCQRDPKLGRRTFLTGDYERYAEVYSDESLAELAVSGLKTLVLRGNPITDLSLPHLATIASLDLSDTKCTGTGLGQLTKTTSLVLDNTSVDDAAIKQLLASNKVLSQISLRNTLATDSILVTLQQTTSLAELAIGDGQITREGLLAVAFAPPERLSLNSKKFDGSLFADWHPSVRRLDMSDSGVSNDDVASLKNVRGLTELSLANCKVSDACLPTLAALGVSKLDLTGTQVTASAVAKQFPKTTAVYLSAAQCQPEQLAAPEQDSSVRIGVRMEIDVKRY